MIFAAGCRYVLAVISTTWRSCSRWSLTSLQAGSLFTCASLRRPTLPSRALRQPARQPFERSWSRSRCCLITRTDATRTCGTSRFTRRSTTPRAVRAVSRHLALSTCSSLPLLGRELYFSFSALTLLVGWQEGHPACRKLGVGLSVVTIWLEFCTSYSSSCRHHFHHP